MLVHLYLMQPINGKLIYGIRERRIFLQCGCMCVTIFPHTHIYLHKKNFTQCMYEEVHFKEQVLLCRYWIQCADMCVVAKVRYKYIVVSICP